MQDARDRFSPKQADGRPQGPLGGVGALMPDPAAAWFLRRMRLHDLGGHLREDPRLLWSDPQPGWRDMGVLAHLQEDRRGGPLDFQEVLVILSRFELEGEAEEIEDWLWEAEQSLEAALAEHARSGTITLRAPEHPLRVSVLLDGDRRMQGASFGLVAGEYITALLPSCRSHTPGTPGAYELRLELREVAEDGVREASLSEDQPELTLGPHWLDSVQHPCLPMPATLILQQPKPGGPVQARLNPALEERYTLVSHGGAGAQVHLLREGERTLARLVVKRVGASKPAPAPAAPTPAVRVAGVQPWRPRSQLLETPARSEALALRQVGTLVQRSRHPHRMLGHDLYLSADGSLRPEATRPAARLEVRRVGESNHVQLIPLREGLKVKDAPLPPERPLQLDGRTELRVDGRPFIYEDLRDVSLAGWPYVGELRTPAGPPKRARPGERSHVGRAGSAWLRLPDSPAADNILWLEGGRPDNSEDSLRGVSLRTDALGVGLDHAVLDLTGEQAVLEAHDPRYPSFIRRRVELLPVVPEGPGEPARVPLCHGDELLIGGLLFKVVEAKAK